MIDRWIDQWFEFAPIFETIMTCVLWGFCDGGSFHWGNIWKVNTNNTFTIFDDFGTSLNQNFASKTYFWHRKRGGDQYFCYRSVGLNRFFGNSPIVWSIQLGVNWKRKKTNGVTFKKGQRQKKREQKVGHGRPLPNCYRQWAGCR